MLDYRPDLDPRTPGLLTAVTEMIPSAKGMRCAYVETSHSGHTYSLAANEVYPNMLFATRWKSTPGGIVLVSSNKKIYVYDFTNGFQDVANTVTYGGTYNLTGATFQYGEDSSVAFDFCAFGDVLIGCNKAVNTQTRTALSLSAAVRFIDLTDGLVPPPKANTCCAARNFVFLADCASWASVTGSSDIIAWCGIGNHLEWSNNPTITQSSYAQLNDTPGPITAVRPFRDGIIVFKADAIYRGIYVGSGTNSPIWLFELISDKVGCVGHRSVTNIDTALVFVGKDDVFSFDGTYPVSITRGMYETIRPYLSDSGNAAMLVGHDKPNSSVWLAAASTGLTYVWDYKKDRWGRLTNLGASVPCYTNADDFRKKTLSTVTAGVQSYTTTTDHYNLYTLTLSTNRALNRNTTRSALATLTSGVVGGPNEVNVVDRFNPIFSIAPVTVGNASVTVWGGKTPATLSSLGNKTMSADYRTDLLAVAGIATNFFRFVLAVTEDFEIIDLFDPPKRAGAR